MSLYGDYILEREGREIVESEYGFATYTFLENSCYIIDIYVVPEFRKQGAASKLADDVTKEAMREKCDWLLGSVDPRANGSTDSVKVLLAYGFKLYCMDEKLVYFRKSLQE